MMTIPVHPGSDGIVGHIPHELALIVSYFLRRDFNYSTAVVIGANSLYNINTNYCP